MEREMGAGAQGALQELVVTPTGQGRKEEGLQVRDSGGAPTVLEAAWVSLGKSQRY